jgi:AcrR family transcriptional regulator
MAMKGKGQLMTQHNSDAPARRRRKQARPSEIIDAGLQEFAEKGFAATRLEDVAHRAGIVKGTIYLYFPSKEALFVAALRARVAPVIDHVDGLAEGYQGSAEDLLRIVIRTIHERLVNTELRTLMRIMIAEGHRFPELTRFYYEEIIAKGRLLLERIIALGLTQGEFDRTAVARAPMVIMAPALMAAIWKLLFEPYHPVAPEDFAEAHTDLVFKGLLSRSTGAS